MEAAREKLSYEEDRECLSRQFIRLGDMMGDGLHLESDGKWISKEYRRVAKALGYIMPGKKRANNSGAINEKMDERVKQVACRKCGGTLKQSRSGSMQAKCTSCQAKFQLLKVSRSRP